MIDIEAYAEQIGGKLIPLEYYSKLNILSVEYHTQDEHGTYKDSIRRTIKFMTDTGKEHELYEAIQIQDYLSVRHAVDEIAKKKDSNAHHEALRILKSYAYQFREQLTTWQLNPLMEGFESPLNDYLENFIGSLPSQASGSPPSQASTKQHNAKLTTAEEQFLLAEKASHRSKIREGKKIAKQYERAIKHYESLLLKQKPQQKPQQVRTVEPIRWRKSQRLLSYLIEELASRGLIAGDEINKLIKDHFVDKDGNPIPDSITQNRNGAGTVRGHEEVDEITNVIDKVLNQLKKQS